MSGNKAIYYGEVQIIPGIICDGYVLDNEISVLSERGTAALLDMDHISLKRVEVNWPPKSLKPFIDKGFIVEANWVEVTAKNSPHQGRKIAVHTVKIIENLIRGYALAYAHDKLRETQIHIGKRAIILLSLLVRTALDLVIKEACGFIPDVQKTSRRYYKDAIFEFEMRILVGALRSVYPGLTDKQYGGLLAKCFQYCYEDVLGKESYSKIKEEKANYPLHQYIPEERTRKMCISYINSLASQIAILGCPITEAREQVRILMREILEETSFSE